MKKSRCVLWAGASYGPVRLMGREIGTSISFDIEDARSNTNQIYRIPRPIRRKLWPKFDLHLMRRG